MKVYGILSVLVILLIAITDASGAAKSQHDKVVACYIASWAVYRTGAGKFGISDNLRPELCTHLIYTFAGINRANWSIRSLDPDNDITGLRNYRRITELRQKYPHLKTVSLAIGGWNEGAKNFSDLAAVPEHRETFINSVILFLQEYGFNGFDLDWEFPADASRGGVPADRDNFVLLLKELKEAFKEYRYSLTAAIVSNRGMLDNGYDIPEISKYLDHIYVMAYDYHGTWDRKVLPNSPLNSQDGADVKSTIKYLLDKGAPPSKLVLGVPMYGRTYILTTMPSSPQESPINKPCQAVGFSGPYTNEKGFMGYNEICLEIMNNKTEWSIGWDEGSSTPYAVKGDKVVVYDNPTSIKRKTEFALEMKLGGVMIWSIDTDDFRGNCKQLREYLDPKDPTFPLMRTINMVLSNSTNQGKPNINDTNNSSNRCFLSFTLISIALMARYAW
ncbi:putative chitinase 2 [Lasioglossum baleicum]|uniref:putative chitinase 2 n=1 Tax=Lasioglossum baleicum TaxID=434251 RepID=UPI003FCC50B3